MGTLYVVVDTELEDAEQMQYEWSMLLDMARQTAHYIYLLFGRRYTYQRGNAELCEYTGPGMMQRHYTDGQGSQPGPLEGDDEADPPRWAIRR